MAKQWPQICGAYAAHGLHALTRLATPGWHATLSFVLAAVAVLGLASDALFVCVLSMLPVACA